MRVVVARAQPLLPDVLTEDLDVVFCGTAAGKASARAKAYYAHPQNRFWWALHQSGLTDRQFQPQEFRSLLDCRLGLTDLAKYVCGNDKELDAVHFDAEALRRKIDRYRPRIVAFTSKNAARVFLGGQSPDYGLQPAMHAATRLFVLSSPSGSGRGHWSLDPWLALAQVRDDLVR